MNTKEILRASFANLPNLSGVHKKMLTHLFTLIFGIHGRINFTNLARHSPQNECTFRRQFDVPIDWKALNLSLIESVCENHEQLLIGDASAIAKSGRKTYGKDNFWFGCDSVVKSGLEINCVAVLDLVTHQAYALDVTQTPANLNPQRTQNKKKRGSTEAQPPKTKGRPKKTATAPQKNHIYNRMDVAIEQLQETWPKNIRYGVFDGAYANARFLDAMTQMGKQVVTKLKSNANLKYLATSEEIDAHRAKNRRSRPIVYGSKVDWKELDGKRWKTVELPEEKKHLVAKSAVLYAPQFKRQLLVVYVMDLKTQKSRTLTSTDLNQDPRQVVEFYALRFQIEFLFRDAKQFTGLEEAQTRQQDRLDFHFNLSLTAVNIARIEMQKHKTALSMNDYTRMAQNELLLNFLLNNIGENTQIYLSPEIQRKTTRWGLIHTLFD